MDESEDLSRSSDAEALLESMRDNSSFLLSYLGLDGIGRLGGLLSGEELTLMISLLPRIAAFRMTERSSLDATLTAMAHLVMDVRDNRPPRIPVSQVLADLRAVLDAGDSSSTDHRNIGLEERLQRLSEHPGWASVSEHPGWASVSEHPDLERLQLPLSELLALSSVAEPPGWGRPQRQAEYSGRSSVLTQSGRFTGLLENLGLSGPLVLSSGDDGLLRALRESMAAGELKREERILSLPEETYVTGPEPVSCTVCLEEFDDGVSVIRLACEHLYHSACIREWVCHRATCPSCRAEVVTR